MISKELERVRALCDTAEAIAAKGGPDDAVRARVRVRRYRRRIEYLEAVQEVTSV